MYVQWMSTLVRMTASKYAVTEWPHVPTDKPSGMYVQWMSTLLWMTANAYAVTDWPRRAFSEFVGWCTLFRWSAWNTILVLWVIQAHDGSPWRPGLFGVPP